VGVESGAEGGLAMIGQRRVPLEEELAEWKAWTAEHRNDVHRLREVDSLIAEHRRQHQPSLERQLHSHRDVGRDAGIDLGL
jgi:hypothetical protein